MELPIRPFHPSDLPALYRICLQTVADGGDGSSLYGNPDLVGHFFIAPYATLEPDLCFVLLWAGQPYGYICGTRNVDRFREICEERWFPTLRGQFSLAAAGQTPADVEATALLHEGIDLNEDVKDYPARLHIALLPPVQRQGGGRRLMQRFLGALRENGVPAVHLEVSRQNPRAIAFYEAMGFHRIVEYPGALEFGVRLG